MGSTCTSQKMKEVTVLWEKKNKTKTYKKAVLKILGQGLYNCTPLQAWIKLRVFYYSYVALISVVQPAAKFSTEKTSEKPKFSTEGLVTHHLHSHGQPKTMNTSSSRQTFERESSVRENWCTIYCSEATSYTKNITHMDKCTVKQTTDTAATVWNFQDPLQQARDSLFGFLLHFFSLTSPLL